MGRSSLRRRSGVLVCCAALGGVCAAGGGHALAAAPPKPGKANPPRYVATLDKKNSLLLREAVSNRDLVAGGNQPVAYGAAGGIKPTIALVNAAGGADMVVTFKNSTSAPQKLGTIGLTGVRFGPNVKHWQFGQDTKVMEAKGFGTSITLTYPGGTYSPVQVLSDGQHTVGISLLYPVVEYGHTVQRFMVGSEKRPGMSESERTWAVGYRLDGELPPGATRTYTLAVRAAAASQSWLETVVPYRDYFQRTYGAVKYQRDDRPVVGMAAAFMEKAGPGNPRGWVDQAYRPDVNGWGPWAAKLKADAARGGYQRAMLWTPSGVFDKSKGNFPFQFMTGIMNLPKAAATVGELAAVSADGKIDLGYWWGHSVSVMKEWNPSASHPLDPTSADDVARGFAELDTAVAAGATMVGLDAFQMAKPRALYQWMQMMQARHPKVRFITENAASDLIHNLAPTFHEAAHVHNPHVMADFLNPGHETWAAMTTWGPNVAVGKVPTQAQKEQEIQRLRGLGFVPLTYGVVVQPANPADSRSWLRTVPETLRATDLSRLSTDVRVRATGPLLPGKQVEMARLPSQSKVPPAVAAAIRQNARAKVVAGKAPEKREKAPISVLTSAEAP
ncbi:MAG: hypothetical protein ACKVS8_10520 [Phycisphaerales bacterium]